MAVHQKFQVSLDDSQYQTGLKRMESQTKQSTQRTASEFNRVDSAMTRKGGGMNRVGGIALQAQDVAVQMQMGASGARILAQQGSQIASLFGPAGMIVGGVIAIGAAIWEATAGAKKLREESEKKAKADKEAASYAATIKGAQSVINDRQATNLAVIRAEQGDKAAEAAERQLELEKRIQEIRGNKDLRPEMAAAMEADARNNAAIRERAQFQREARERGAERVAAEGQEVLDRAAQIRGKGPSKAEARREQREQARAERRAIAEEMDRIDRQERNALQGTARARTKGLNIGEREKGIAAREAAVRVAKDNKLQATIDQQSITAILNGIDALLAK